MMAITTREDYILCELEKMEMSTGRCEKSTEFIADADQLAAELDTLALQIENCKRAARNLIERYGKTPLAPTEGGCK